MINDQRPTTNDQRPIRLPARNVNDLACQPQQPASAADPTPAAEDVTFTRGPARRLALRVADPLLQWSTGLTTKERTIYAGWLTESNVHMELDNAMELAGFAQVTIKHGSGNLVTHWAIETANLFIVADGVQSIAEMKHTSERYGIAFGWRTLESGRQQSQLRLRCFLRELLAVGFVEPLLLSVKSTLTGDLIAALTRQYDVLDAVDQFRAASGKPPLRPPFYACSIPLGPGQEVARGSVQAKEIVPVVAQIAEPVTKEHIKAHCVWVPVFVTAGATDIVAEFSSCLSSLFDPSW